ncbi:hypothetical protein TRFO_37506 [Tritrichomonas foetus]|uniref:Uncharacterized protein n=1 Tax=Tritrichomonas foetus TaxID=1144522 RepID=A0A1J4JGI4_9EUKA|nr:hypothetical protein TRFO_37506 [Tritrichomonas foetus]|eukprot:OHS96316.1 hypothetical protein TRFO_37506 [Tritrichomonas foetus]
MILASFFFTLISSSCQSDLVYGGNPLVEYSEHSTVDGFESMKTTPVQVNVIPLESETIQVDQVSNYLNNNGWLNQADSENIQKRLSFSNIIKSVFHDFSSANSTFNFYSLPKDQQTLDNFYNLNLQRSSILLSAIKENNTVILHLKKVTASMRKRKSDLKTMKYIYPMYCHDIIQQCGYEPVQTTKCQFVPVKVGSMTQQQMKCSQITSQVYKCKMVPTDYQQSGAQLLYKYELNSNYNQGEVDDIYSYINQAAAQQLAFT